MNRYDTIRTALAQLPASQIQADALSALRELQFSAGAFYCDPDESAGAYELSDPKHPRYHSTYADIWDSREGK